MALEGDAPAAVATNDGRRYVADSGRRKGNVAVNAVDENSNCVDGPQGAATNMQEECVGPRPKPIPWFRQHEPLSAELKEALARSECLKQPEFQQVAEEVMTDLGPFALWRFLYEWSVRSGYLSEERLELDVVMEERYDHEHNCMLQATFSLSKPEIIHGVPDVRKLAAKAQCVICWENVDSDFKPGLRAYEITLNGRDFFIHYPPYPYCDGHVVVVEKMHVEQIIDEDTVGDLLDFSSRFRGIYIASNTDRSGTGASILQHRHYQAAKKRFPVFMAESVHSRRVTIDGGLVEVDILKYPCVAVRLISACSKALKKMSCLIMDNWRLWGIPDLLNRQPFNQTMSFLCWQELEPAGRFEMIMIPRTCEMLTQPSLHCIKAEFVGVLEMAGYAVLPGRLNTELRVLSRALFEELPIPENLSQFQTFVDLWYSPTRERMAQCEDEWEIMEAALIEAFAAIISNNSPFPSIQLLLATKWLDLAMEHLENVEIP